MDFKTDNVKSASQRRSGSNAVTKNITEEALEAGAGAGAGVGVGTGTGTGVGLGSDGAGAGLGFGCGGAP